MPTYRFKGPDGKIHLVRADTEAAAIEGMKSFTPAQTDARKMVTSQPGALRSANNGASFGLDDEVDAAMMAGKTGLQNLASKVGVGQGKPYGAREAYDTALAVRKEEDDKFKSAHPAVSLGTEIGGGLMGGLGEIGLIKGAMGSAPGMIAAIKSGAPALKEIPILGGLLGGKGIVPVTARSAATGGLLGGLSGAGTAEPGQRVQGAVRGAGMGAVVGGAAPSVINAAGAVGRTGARLANKATGGNLLNPQNEIGKRLAESLTKDGLGPTEIRSAMNEWMKTGASGPAFMDIVRASPNGGEATMGLLRGAAMKGPARNVAAKYQQGVEANLQDNAIERTRQLTPDQRSPSVIRKEIEQGRSERARTNYVGPYAEPVPVTPEIRAALQDPEGQAATARAAAGARGFMDYPAMQDIEGLASGQGDMTTGRALDRIQQAFGRTGEGLVQKEGARDLAGGAFHRQGIIDQALDQVPGLAPARADYRAASNEIGALDLGIGKDPNVGNPFTNPRRYVERIDELGRPVGGGDQTFQPRAQDMAAIGLTDDIIRNIGNPAAGSTGYLNKLSTGNNPQTVLNATIGPERTANYQAAIGNEADRLNNARFINPNTGSQTAGRAVDESLVEMPNFSKAGLIKALMDKLRSGATMTDQERQGLVQLGVGDAQQGMNTMIPSLEDMLRERLGARQAATVTGGNLGGRQ